MKNFVISVGGTGNKILEAMVYGACADIFYTMDEKGNRAPVDEIRVLIVDVDESCGNTTRSQQAGEAYERVRRAFESVRMYHRGFNTKLTITKWVMDQSRAAVNIKELTQNHDTDKLLANMLFSEAESCLRYSEGFRGHPDLGVLFFSDILYDEERGVAAGKRDEMNSLVDDLKACLEAGENAKVLLCGSIFGGTGASGVPTIGNFLRQRLSAYYRQLDMGVVLMLPYFNVPPSSVEDVLDIQVQSSLFLDKARTALHYYGMAGMVRSGQDDEQGIFDAMYLLGLPQDQFVQMRRYSTGSQSQENDSHLLEWLAARCVADFLRNPRKINCYLYQINPRALSWDSFGEERELYRLGYAGLMKAACVYFSECYPFLKQCLSTVGRGRANCVNYYASYFSRLSALPANEKEEVAQVLDSFALCLSSYCRWMFQTIRTLPPAMRSMSASERCLENARGAYRDYLKAMAELELTRGEEEAAPPAPEESPQKPGKMRLNRRAKPVETRLDKARDAAVHAGERKEAAFQKIDGVERLKLIRAFVDVVAGEARLEKQNIREIETRIQGMEAQDEVKRDEERLMLDRASLKRAQRRLNLIGEQQKILKGELENTHGIQAQFDSAAAVREDEGFIPDNGLFDRTLMEALDALLGVENGTQSEDDAERLSDVIQKHIQDITVSRMRDTVTLPQIIAGLCGSRTLSDRPDVMVASFFSTLLRAVFDVKTGDKGATV